jgi:transposase
MERLSDEQVAIQPLEHLGLVAAVIDKIGLTKKIDSRLLLTEGKGAKISMGQRVAAMILNGLGFIDDRLYMFPEFLSNKPIDRLLGKNIKAEDFNDDALGRCLDKIYEYGVTKLFSEVAFEIGIENNLLGKSAHFDTSTLAVYGEYSTEDSPKTVNRAATPKTKQPINITQGYSKDHRHDLKQMVINLATSGVAGFPVWMEAHSGNASDKVIIQEATERMRTFCNQLKDAPSFLYVGDSAMYENCVKKAGDLKWLSRVPETLKEAKIFLSLADSDFTWTDIGDGYLITPLESSYGNIKQRWLLVSSEQALTKELKTLEKNIAQEKEAMTKVLWHLSKQAFACESDARKAGNETQKNLKYHNVKWDVTSVAKHGKKGRPQKGLAATKLEYFITGTLIQDTEKIELKKRAKGRFILATNELDEQKLSNAEMLPEYKEQSKTESGFRFIKDNAMEVASVFLKKASRVEALMMVMTLCLMVYSFAQHQLRKALADANETIPDQRKKPTSKPTMSWVCRMFSGVGIVFINLDIGTQSIVANLNDVTKRIVRYFGPHAEYIYGISVANA